MWVKCEINKSRANGHSPLQFSFSFEIPVAFVCSKAKGKEAEEEEEYLALAVVVRPKSMMRILMSRCTSNLRSFSGSSHAMALVPSSVRANRERQA